MRARERTEETPSKTPLVAGSDVTPRWLALTRGDLAVMVEKFNRENHRPRQWGTMLAGFGSLATAAGLAALGDVLHWPDVLGPVFLGGGWAGALTAFGIVIQRERKLRTEYNVACPSCEAPLLQKGKAELAVATGNCPSCGAKILAD